MATTSIATLEEIETEGLTAFYRGDMYFPINNKMVWETIEGMEAPVGDPQTIAVFVAFQKGWMRGHEETMKEND